MTTATKTTVIRHTPGPWRCEQHSDGLAWEINSDPATGKWAAICTVGPNALGQRAVHIDEAEANARLIAAAPELLETLRDLVAAFGESPGMMERAASIGVDAQLHSAIVLLWQLRDSTL